MRYCDQRSLIAVSGTPAFKRRVLWVLLALLPFTLACGGIGLACEYDLTQDYAIWAPDLLEQAAVVRKDAQGSGASVVVQPMVFSFGWNEAFIIAMQHPKRDHFEDVDNSVTRWFIVEVATDTVHGPLTEDEYEQLRLDLNIPDVLDFSETIEL